MAIEKDSFGRDSVYWSSGHCLTFLIPTELFTYYYADGDPQNLSDGDVISIDKAWPYPISMCTQVIDAAGSDLDLSLTISGIDHLGRARTESLTGLGDTTGTGTSVQGTVPWSWIENVTIDSISGALAADEVNFGVRGAGNSDSAQTEVVTVGLPGGVRSQSDLKGVMASNSDRTDKWTVDGDEHTMTQLIADTTYQTNSQVMAICLDPRVMRL